jgi:hypothetical protein
MNPPVIDKLPLVADVSTTIRIVAALMGSWKTLVTFHHPSDLKEHEARSRAKGFEYASVVILTRDRDRLYLAERLLDEIGFRMRHHKRPVFIIHQGPELFLNVWSNGEDLHTGYGVRLAGFIVPTSE